MLWEASSIGKYYYILFLKLLQMKTVENSPAFVFWSKQDLAVIPQEWVKTLVQSKKNLETCGQVEYSGSE